MMRQVVTDVEGNKYGSSYPTLPNVVSGVTSITGSGHTAVFSNRPESIKNLIHGYVGKNPQREIQQRITAYSKESEYEQLT
tara:strand:- start:126 stop:368 length:243 start_codon:yes stop_codon:yes gene_type:complete